VNRRTGLRVRPWRLLDNPLGRGRYRWYVWPGIGKIVDAKYGSLIGTSMFVVG
jgi:hypothetical protein